MKQFSLVDPLPENGTLMVRINYEMIMALKEAVNFTEQRETDRDKKALYKELFDDLLELKALLVP